ncbi:MAG TPA: hypothetical protein VGF85_13670, partial [Opitutaceae bacterium]
MTPVQIALSAAVAIAVLVYAVDPGRPRLLRRYTRMAVLVALAALFLAPFAWIACAAFKDRRTLMEVTFLPPPS